MINMFPTPADMAKLGADWWRLTYQTQMVMALRLSGMAGYWSMKPDEPLRMVLEKGPAFGRAAMAAGEAAAKGKRPDQITRAAMKPLSRKTKRNVKRLTRQL